MKLSTQEREIIQSFFTDKPVKRAYVFGSYARGEADSSSDIDLLIEWDYSEPIGWKWVRHWRELKEKLNKDVDFVSLKWLDPKIEDWVHRDKELIYERQNR